MSGSSRGRATILPTVPRRKPDYCLNLGITWPGMIALELKDRVPTLSFRSFGAFVAGAAERAALVGDIGPSAPANWVGGFGTGPTTCCSRCTRSARMRCSAYSDRLSALFAEGDAFREIWRHDGMALMEMQDGKPVPTSKVHFGYTDGISQTTIRGGPERYPPDHQIAVRAVAVRSFERGRELLRAGAAGTGPQRQLRRLQDGRNGRRRFREFPAVEPRTRSIPSCSPPRCADGGATACR